MISDGACHGRATDIGIPVLDAVSTATFDYLNSYRLAINDDKRVAVTVALRRELPQFIGKQIRE